MGTMSEDVIMYASQQINVPLNLPYILKQYAKAAIKTQPKDLLHWSSAYFRALANGDVPPVKDRIEYPLISTPSGLTAGYLRILIKQFGKSGLVQEKELMNKWKGVGLETNELLSMLKLCGFRKTIRWLNFIAVAAGFLSPNLTQTMILICELLTDEPEGGSAAIIYHNFMTLYMYLARMDCGPICHLKNNMAGTFSEESLTDEQTVQPETASEKSSEKLSDIEVALERKPTSDSNDSTNDVMIWKDVMHPDLVQEPTTEESVVTEDVDNILVEDVVDEQTTTVDEEEKADDQVSIKSVESYDNTGITLTFHDTEQDVQIDDYTGPIEPKLKKRYANRAEEKEKEATTEKTDKDESKENEEEHGEEKTDTLEEVDKKEEDGENGSDSKTEDDKVEHKEDEDKIGHKVEEDEIGHKVEEDKIGDKVEREGDESTGDGKRMEDEEEELKKETGATEEKKELGGNEGGEKTTKKKKRKDDDGGEKKENGEEEEESDHEEQSHYEYSLELEEEEEIKVMEDEEKSVNKEDELVEEQEETKDEEEEVIEEEELKEEEVKEEQTADQESLDSAIPFQGQRKSDVAVYGELHLPKQRTLSFTDSIISEPDNHFWIHVPGIGPIVPEKQILSLKAYFLFCSERQHGYVMPRNIKHHLCPSLEPPAVEMEIRDSTDVECIIKDVPHGDS